MLKAYLANGLFGLGDIMVNEIISVKLRDFIEDLQLHVPQEDLALNNKDFYADSKMIAIDSDKNLEESNFVIAVIDGVEIDSGVACQIGVASALNKPIFALYTDVRQKGRINEQKINALINDGAENQFMYRNLYVIGKIKNSGGGIYSSIETLIKDVKKYVDSN